MLAHRHVTSCVSRLSSGVGPSILPAPGGRPRSQGGGVRGSDTTRLLNA